MGIVACILLVGSIFPTEKTLKKIFELCDKIGIGANKDYGF